MFSHIILKIETLVVLNKLINSIKKKRYKIEICENLSFRKCNGIIPFKIGYWGSKSSGKNTSFMRLQEKYAFTNITNAYKWKKNSVILGSDAHFLSFNYYIDGAKYGVVVEIVICSGKDIFFSTKKFKYDNFDGVIFVASSNPEKTEQNKKSFRELINFINHNYVPIVIQLNKRDLTNAISIESFKKQINLFVENEYLNGKNSIYPSVATDRNNVNAVKCFQGLIHQIIHSYFYFFG